MGAASWAAETEDGAVNKGAVKAASEDGASGDGASGDGASGDGASGDGASKKGNDAGFATAGVCSRCHVLSVLEWSVSGHVEAETTCQECHGTSRGHVANERNEVKPDRRPTGAKIAALCLDCHDAGCPEVQRIDACQECHHMHALLDPRQSVAEADPRRQQLVLQWRGYQDAMAAGERLLAAGQLAAARDAFRRAVELVPSSQEAAERVAACVRRIRPSFPGFETVGDASNDGVDVGTGLPQEVQVVGTDLRMVLVRGGEVDLGDERFASARPVHTVDVDSFYLGKFEVTQTQWEQWMGENPSHHQGEQFPDSPRMPVERVSWQDCQRFVARLNQEVPGAGFRLPTEKEWEFAARASDSRGPMHARAVYRRVEETHLEEGGVVPDAFRGIDAFAPRTVGSLGAGRLGAGGLGAGGLGLYDLFGNVNEWCDDRFGPYGVTVASSDDVEHRVLRGGSYADGKAVLHPAFRHRERPQRRLRYNGLRLARSIPMPSETPPEVRENRANGAQQDEARQ